MTRELSLYKSLGSFEIYKTPVSANELMRMRDYRRNKLLSDWRYEVSVHLAQGEFSIPKDVRYPVVIEFTQIIRKGGRAFDDDNRSGMAKLINDALKRLELIPDDSPKYVRTEYGDAIRMADKPYGGVRVQVFGMTVTAVDAMMQNEYRPPFEVWYANGGFHISWDDGEGGRNYPDPDHQGEEGYDHNEDGKKAAEHIQKLLNEFHIYKDDCRDLTERLEACLNNSRCPECGCGDVNDAESNECGCDAPVCGIECPETLAEAYIRVTNELATLGAEVKKLRNTIDCGCNALTDSICCSGNDAETNMGFVHKMRRAL